MRQPAEASSKHRKVSHQGHQLPTNDIRIGGSRAKKVGSTATGGGGWAGERIASPFGGALSGGKQSGRSTRVVALVESVACTRR